MNFRTRERIRTFWNSCMTREQSLVSCLSMADDRSPGYKGHRQQQARDPLDAFFFGISVYRSQRAEAELLAVKFEIL